MSQFIVRRVLTGDVPGASRVITRSIRHAYAGFIDNNYLESLTGDSWLPLLSGDLGAFICYIAVLGANVAGAAVIRDGAVPGTPNCGELSALYVDPKHFNQGIGTALLKRSIETMRRQRLTECVLNVLKDNSRAINFYKKRGFIMLNMTYNKKIGEKYYEFRYMKIPT